MTAIVVVHIAACIYVANKVERFGFVLMFILIVVEVVLWASVILKAIPEDYQLMVDYIERW